MEALRIRPSRLRGTISIPPSKSHTLRAILFGSLGEGETIVDNYLPSPDTTAMIGAMRNLGATIHVESDQIQILGTGGQPHPTRVIEADRSGIVYRFCTALAALTQGPTKLIGDPRRPIAPLFSALEQLGAAIENMKIQGPIRPGSATLCGKDSQPISALLIATSFLKGTTYLTITDPGEMPWIEMTLAWLRRFGAKISHENYHRYTIQGPILYPGFQITIPADFSSAAFPYIASLITGSQLTLKNLDHNDVQGDKKIFSISRDAQTIDAGDMIDAVPALAVLGCFAKGPMEIINAQIARHKESDRLHAITKELRKMGAKIEERPDGLLITPSPLHGADLHSHHDHRIAMALAVAALAAKGESTLTETSCIAKTYPTFISDFQELGAAFKIIQPQVVPGFCGRCEMRLNNFESGSGSEI